MEYATDLRLCTSSDFYQWSHVGQPLFSLTVFDFIVRLAHPQSLAPGQESWTLGIASPD